MSHEPLFTPKKSESLQEQDLLANSDTACTAPKRGDCESAEFVFSEGDPQTQITINACRDPKTGIITDWGQKFIKL